MAGVTSLSVIAAAYDTSDSDSEEVECISDEKNKCTNGTNENDKEVHVAESEEVECISEEKNKCTNGSNENNKEEHVAESEEIECISEEKNKCTDANEKEAQITESEEVACISEEKNKCTDAHETEMQVTESEEVECISEENNKCTNTNEVEVQITKEYRNKTIIETSDESSDSDDSSSDAESSESSEDDSDESDASNEDGKSSCEARKKNERNSRQKGSQEKESKGEFDNLPPIEDLKISVPEVLCDPLGEVGWMVEQMVVVRPKPGKPTLNLDTMLFVERGRRVLGRIFDVFGQVSEPHYCVRFNSTEHIKESDIKVGMTVYFCPNTEYTSVVFLQDLLKMKVTDELGDDEHPEFSDDEEERAYFAALKQKQKNEKAKCTEDVPQKRQRMGVQGPTWKSNHPWSSRRKPQQPGNTYTAPDWADSSQQNACHPTNLWQYPSSYPSNPWPPGPEPYPGNAWPTACPQNAYGYPGQFDNRHPRPNPRQFFRPPSFQSSPNPYAPSGPYAQQPNSARYPGPNFPWRSQSPRQPGMAWPLPPAPPPPPPGI